jgi:hypothetical protein
MNRTVSLLVLLAACGGGSGSSALTNYCKADCAKQSSCGMTDDACQSSCESSVYSSYNEDVLRGFQSCQEQQDCTTVSSNCTDAVINRQPRRSVDDAYDRACLTRQGDCGTASVECGKFTNPYSESFVKDRLQPCLSVPCDQIQACEGALI